MSSRVTRSSARLAADSAANHPPPPPPPPPPAPAAPRSRKRKAAATSDPDPATEDDPPSSSPQRRPKRTKFRLAASPHSRPPPNPPVTMSNPGSSSRPTEESKPPAIASNPSKGRPTRASKKSGTALDTSPPTHTPPNRRQKKRASKRDSDVTMKEAEDSEAVPSRDGQVESPQADPAENNDSGVSPRGRDDDEDDDPFRSPYLSGSRLGMSNTIRALTSMMSGVSSRLRDILTNLRQKDDPSIQLIALQELSDLLLVSNEDNLSGHFSPDPYVKELVTLMQPSDTGEENPEMMLLACRCIANLMEALQGSVANVVYGGAVPILCQKLLEIHFIDLAEQALSTLAKISVDFPTSIVREGGLTACLTYLDFFPTSTQRTAVTTAANCCRNIPEDSFSVIRDVMPILLNVLETHDQKVVEQGCLCVSRIVESFKYKNNMLEELVSPDLLRAILRLLLPGTTNLIGHHIHTQFLRVLSITARASPRLSVELLKMNVVDTLYQMLTGVSPPSSTEDVASKIDSVVIMQALIHRPREQVFETLNVICELLPGIPSRHGAIFDSDVDMGYTGESVGSLRSSSRSANQKRVELLNDCKEETKRFAMILLPTLTDAYSSTVNLSVRQKVITAQLKMLSNLDTQIIEDSLRTVPYASFLASILSQQDHPSLVNFGLQATELLLERLEHIYQYQFYREGVIAEIKKLADEPLEVGEARIKLEKSQISVDSAEQGTDSHGDPDNDENMDGDSSDEDDDGQDDVHDDVHEDEDGGEDDHEDDREPMSASSSSSSDGDSVMLAVSSIKDLITVRAKRLLENHQSSIGQEKCEQASKILQDLQTLAKSIEDHYLHAETGDGRDMFSRLASYFDGDAVESITSSELLNSGIVDVLLKILNSTNNVVGDDARVSFLSSFMRQTLSGRAKTTSTESPSTPFGVLVHKLQDLLSRAEHFEVITVHSSSDSSRSSAASMLAKQLRLKLTADDDSDIPRPFRNIMVSIHAIATFKALDDYLRPRISLSERPRGSRHRDAMSSTLAAYASAARLHDPNDRPSDGGLFGIPADLPPMPPSNPASGGKSSRVASRSKTSALTPQEARSSSSRAKETTARRSSRRVAKSSNPPPDPEAPTQPLECADERQVSDDDDVEDDGPLDAIVDDLEDDMSDDGLMDPTAVNMEIASTGKVTARKEDGTRVATPNQASTPVSRPSSSAQPTAAQPPPPPPPSLALAGRPFSSYAAAMAAVPQDWHIEFSVEDKKISHETTIYRAVYHNKLQPDDTAARNVWSAIHSIKFKRVKGPAPPEGSSITPPPESAPEQTASGMPVSLDKNAITSSILKLLSLLHDLNANLADVFVERREAISVNAEPLSQFINTKLTAKMNRQLEEPLIVASNCLPSWSEDLARLFPFLFPFETRHLFLQSTSYGYSRSMQRWQNSQSVDDERRDRRRDDRPFLGRLQRQKVRISRSRILESAVKVMELYGASPSVLEVEFFDEVGTGLGPTLEFYSTVSKEFSKKKLKLWRENDSNDRDEYAFGKLGLFPAPMSEDQANHENGKKVLHLFKMLGKFVARAMLDSRIIDVSFNPSFFRIGQAKSANLLSLGVLRSVDSDLAQSLMLVKEFANLKKMIEENAHLSAARKVNAMADIEVYGSRIEDLGLDFTLPGYPSVELVPGGSNVALSIDNVELYLEKVIDFTLGSGVSRQVDAFRAGFSQVFPYSSLRAFTPAELVMLFGRTEEDWSIETLMDSIKADHGFNLDSKSVRNLLQTMSELTPPDRRDFLQFVTGSPKLPIGGFKSLTPMFTVVCKPSEPPYTSDDYLPSVMTCVNYLKLPDYTNLDVLRARLNVAIREGQGAFHLS